MKTIIIEKEYFLKTEHNYEENSIEYFSNFSFKPIENQVDSTIFLIQTNKKNWNPLNFKSTIHLYLNQLHLKVLYEIHVPEISFILKDDQLLWERFLNNYFDFLGILNFDIKTNHNKLINNYIISGFKYLLFLIFCTILFAISGALLDEYLDLDFFATLGSLIGVLIAFFVFIYPKRNKS